MTKKEIEKEFVKIDYELRVNKPTFTPYPLDVVKRREYLLFAQVHLSNILEAKSKKTNGQKILKPSCIRK